jgi:hypothetical protein
MIIGYYYIIPRYTKLINPGEKKVKEIYLYGEIIAAILAS